MKFQHLILYWISVVTLAGCGVSESEHQRVKNELQTTKYKSAYARTDLNTAKQKQDSSLAEQDRVIQDLSASIRAVKASNSEKLAKIDQIMFAEETAMAKADEAYKVGDKTKALNLYNGFLRDFPFSSIVSLAVSKVNELTSSIAKDRRIAEAPIRAAQAAAASAAAAAAQQQRFEKKWQGIEKEVAQTKAGLANHGGEVAKSPGHAETSQVQGKGLSKGEAWADAMSKLPSGHQVTKTYYSKWTSYNRAGNDPIEHHTCDITYLR